MKVDTNSWDSTVYYCLCLCHVYTSLTYVGGCEVSVLMSWYPYKFSDDKWHLAGNNVWVGAVSTMHTGSVDRELIIIESSGWALSSGERGSTITELMATLERWQVGGGGGGGKLRYSLNYPRCCPGDLHYHIPTPYLTQHSAFSFNNLIFAHISSQMHHPLPPNN